MSMERPPILRSALAAVIAAGTGSNPTADFTSPRFLSPVDFEAVIEKPSDFDPFRTGRFVDLRGIQGDARDAPTSIAHLFADAASHRNPDAAPGDRDPDGSPTRRSR